MLQVANTDLFNPLLDPRDHNSECQNLQFPLQIKPGKKMVNPFLPTGQFFATQMCYFN